MNLRDVLEYLSINAPEIGKLHARGDKLAGRVYRAYRYAHEHRTDLKAQNELIKVTEDYVRRDLDIAERKSLHDKLGHKNEDDPIVIVPDAMKVKHAVRSTLRRRH